MPFPTIKLQHTRSSSLSKTLESSISCTYDSLHYCSRTATCATLSGYRRCPKYQLVARYIQSHSMPQLRGSQRERKPEGSPVGGTLVASRGLSVGRLLPEARGFLPLRARPFCRSGVPSRTPDGYRFSRFDGYICVQ